MLGMIIQSIGMLQIKYQKFPLLSPFYIIMNCSNIGILIIILNPYHAVEFPCLPAHHNLVQETNCSTLLVDPCKRAIVLKFIANPHKLQFLNISKKKFQINLEQESMRLPTKILFKPKHLNTQFTCTYKNYSSHCKVLYTRVNCF